jgi:hypothetical protein
MLLFKKKFLPAIRAGEKTQTIRLWKWRQMRTGQRSYIPGAGYVRIDGVDEVQIADLTDADAVPDGFSTAEVQGVPHRVSRDGAGCAEERARRGWRGCAG